MSIRKGIAMKAFVNPMSRLQAASAAALLLCAAAPARADQIHVPFTLAPNGTSAPITVPAVNTPISVSCATTTPGNQFIAQVTLLRGGAPSVLQWLGYDGETFTVNSNLVVKQGSSAVAGTVMVECDFAFLVFLEVQSGTAVQMKSNLGTTQTGVLNFVW